jgi:ABC-2 type transport system ATP-binding protein
MTLVIRDLSKTYPDGTRALEQISLTISRGVFGLLGPNGAGKSTLMRTLATLQDADSGTATMDGIDVLADKEAVRKVLGYLPQEFGLYPNVSAQELLDHFAVMKGVTERGERKALVDALLQRTNLWDARKKQLGGFSGGMRQRFGIATALIGSPRLIIVDEPTAGLDPEERVRFLNLLAELATVAIVILSTHIVEDVAELCSRMAVIDRGRILLEDDPLQAVERLRGKVWRKLVGREDAAAPPPQHMLLSTKLLSGRRSYRVFAGGAPDPAYTEAEPELEDVYFSAIRGVSREVGSAA